MSKSLYVRESDDLWLGVCIDANNGTCTDVCAQVSGEGWRVDGFEDGTIRAYRNSKIHYILHGHDPVAILDLWIIPVGEDIILVSLDNIGNAAWWGLEKGLCYCKKNLGGLIQSTCLFGGRILCVLLANASSAVYMWDLQAQSILYEVQGDCFLKLNKCSVGGETSMLLECEMFNGVNRYFDLKSKSFIELVGDDIVTNEPGNKTIEPAPRDPFYETQFIGQYGLFHVGSSDVFVSVSVSNDDEKLHLTAYHACSIPVCTAEEANSEHPQALLFKSRKFSEFQEVCKIYLIDIPKSELLVCTIDVATLEFGNVSKVAVNLSAIDSLCVSPEAELENICVVDSQVDQTLVIFNRELREMNRIYIGSLPFELDMKWLDSHSLGLGSCWVFDMLWGRILQKGKFCTTPYVYTGDETIRFNDSLPSNSTVDDSQFNASTSTASPAEDGTPSRTPPPTRVQRAPTPLQRQSSSQNLHTETLGVECIPISDRIMSWVLRVNQLQMETPSLKSLMSFFMEWDIDTTLDAQITRVLNIAKPSSLHYRYLVDYSKKHGMYCVLADPNDRWVCSDRFTSTQTLGLISLFIGLIASESLSEHQQAVMSSLVSHYGIVYPEHYIQDSRYIFPSLDIMSHFILSKNASEDIQIASRLLLQVTIERMPAVPTRAAKAAQWAGRLHLSKGQDNYAVVVLGMMGVTHPEDLAPATARIVAQSLQRFIHSRRKEEIVIAAELLARGYYVWCPYIENLPGLIQDLILSYTLDRQEDVSLQPSRPDNNGQSGNIESPLLPSKGSVSSASSACQRALTEIGTAQPLLFVQTIGKEALRPGVHKYALTALSNFIKKKPVALLRFLPAVVEIVIKTLDPSESEIRKACLKYSTIVLHQLVKRYPMVAFHQTSQRFAVGTIESIILIYDLRTATKWRILEGQNAPVTSLYFEPTTGETIMCYSAQERSLRLWQTGVGTGFFGGLLGMQGRCLRVQFLPELDMPNPATPGDIIHNTSLNWSRLIREDGKTTVELSNVK